MSWENITGESSITPSSGNGSQDEVKLESGKSKKIRLILPNDSAPYSYFEHCIEVEVFDNGQLTKTFRTVRCPKTSKDPNAPCKLCDGQRARRRVRHACNCWDYDLGKVQKLNQGEGVFKPIATSRKLGVDILGVDWAIMRTGQDRNDTEYSATNLGPSEFNLTPEIMSQLFDIEADYAPVSEEDMKYIVESAGAKWEDMIVPPELQYPTLAEALAHKMPNGKYKDQTMQAIWDADKSSRGMISFLAIKSNRISPEKAAAQVIYSRLGGVNIPGVPMDDSGATAQQTGTNLPLPWNTNAQPANTTAQQTAPPPKTDTPVSADRQAKIAKINDIFITKEKFVKGGFGLIVDTLKAASGGKTNIQDFNETELDALLAECEK